MNSVLEVPTPQVEELGNNKWKELIEVLVCQLSGYSFEGDLFQSEEKLKSPKEFAGMLRPCIKERVNFFKTRTILVFVVLNSKTIKCHIRVGWARISGLVGGTIKYFAETHGIKEVDLQYFPR